MSLTRQKRYFNPLPRYELPDPLETDTQFEKFKGDDIAGMSELEAWREIKKLEYLLTWGSCNEIMHIDFSRTPGRVITIEEWILARMAKLNGSSI